MVALSVTVHKALILLVFLNHPYQSLAFYLFESFKDRFILTRQRLKCNVVASLIQRGLLYFLFIRKFTGLQGPSLTAEILYVVDQPLNG